MQLKARMWCFVFLMPSYFLLCFRPFVFLIRMLKLHHMNLLNEIQETTLMMNLYQQQQVGVIPWCFSLKVSVEFYRRCCIHPLRCTVFVTHLYSFNNSSSSFSQEEEVVVVEAEVEITAAIPKWLFCFSSSKVRQLVLLVWTLTLQCNVHH